jgi:antitoxin ParD1/3/4
MTSLNISLPEQLKDFVEAQVANGGYGTASEYVRQLIREAAKRVAEDRLEQLLLEGLHSGPATEMTEADWVELRRRARERHARRKTG